MAELNILSDENSVVVRFVDSQILDESHARSIGLKLLQLADDVDDKDLIVNFDNVCFMASTMIGQLVALRNKCHAQQVGLKICCFKPEVAEAISLMNLDKILEVFECEASAKSATQKS